MRTFKISPRWWPNRFTVFYKNLTVPNKHCFFLSTPNDIKMNINFHEDFSIKRIDNEPMHFIPLIDLFRCQAGIRKKMKRKYLTHERREQLQNILNSLNEVILLHYII